MMRQAVRRAFSSVATVEAKAVATEAASKTSFTEAPKFVSKPVPVWRSKISSFLAGVAVTGVFGYIRLREDVYASTSDLKTRLTAAHSDISVLLARIQSLESRTSQLEEARVISSTSAKTIAVQVAEDEQQ